ncbi:hypothetical protein [Myxococcus sp. AB025B]|uniref:hypothetical protein n=1 Tax=Myxococcus sp. AB025B TaxID=2562794 RepID=UPI001142BED9|nr:hypothetical protein [Myxococcus sp. AB025B]
MRTPRNLSSFCVVSLALLGVGCEPSASPVTSREGVALEEKKDRAVGDVRLYCETTQDGSYFELKETATGFEGVVATLEYDPWDCRCIRLKREVVGQYTSCNFAASDPRIANCWRRDANGSTTKAFMSSAKITRQSLVFANPIETSDQLLEVTVVNQDPGQTPRHDLSFPLNDCVAEQ